MTTAELELITGVLAAVLTLASLLTLAHWGITAVVTPPKRTAPACRHTATFPVYRGFAKGGETRIDWCEMCGAYRTGTPTHWNRWIYPSRENEQC